MGISLKNTQVSNGLPKIAIIRGPNLNQWEMHNYEPLTGQFDITAYTTTKPNFDLSKIHLQIEQLPPHPEHPAYMTGLECALFDADLIYSADTTWLFTYQAAQIKQKLGKKLVCLQWENIPFAYEENEPMRALKQVNRQVADAFIAVTERARDALILEGVPHEKITVIPMGIDIERFRPSPEDRVRLRQELGIRHDEMIVLFAGRMVWEKGIYDLIYAAGLLCRVGAGVAPVRFVVVGRGPELDSVKNRIDELRLGSSFILIESYPYHKMHEMFNIADIFVLPSIALRTWKEQFGMVLIEAMSCGIPVISTCSGSIPEVVGDAGILTQPNDPGDLSAAVLRLLRDDNLRKRIGARGRERAVREFNSIEIAKRFGAVFEKVLESRNVAVKEAIPPRTERNVPQCPSGLQTTQLQSDAKLKTGGQSAPSIAGDGIGGADTDYFRQERKEVEVLIPKDAMKILDVGCGEGMLGKRLLEEGAQEVIGIEVNRAVAEKAEKNLSKVLCGDVEGMSLPFEDGYFDCIICADVLEHMREPLSVLKRLKQYLSHSGTLVASIPNVRYYGVINMLANGLWSYGDYGILDRNHLRFFTRKEIERLFREAGFEITGISSNVDPAWWSVAPPYSGDMTFGRVVLKGLSSEEIKDLFVIQYLLKTQKTESEQQRAHALSDAALADGRLEDAEKTLEDYLRLHPAATEFLLRHAEVCYRLGKMDKALESIERLLIFEPQTGEALELKKLIQGIYREKSGLRI